MAFRRRPASTKPTNIFILLSCAILLFIVQFYFMSSFNKEHAVDASQPEEDKTISEKRDECCVQCTTPQNECCLLCSDISSPREHDLLMAGMEGLTHYTMEILHTAQISAVEKQRYGFLKTRAWEGNSHVGNRPAQATFYYDWVRSIERDETIEHVCEIGMNGGHSAFILLAALHSSREKAGVQLTMFDFGEFFYSEPVAKYIQTLYPGMFTVHTGDSRDSVPKWTETNTKNGVYCDVFSVDGDHSYEGALIDIKNAAKATRKGGHFILDDMNPDGPTRKAFDAVVKDGILKEPKCVEEVKTRVGYENRIDDTHARELRLSWCTAKVA